MNYTDITWSGFKNEINSQIPIDKKFIYRGHADSSWQLETTLHRTGQFKTPEDIEFYFDKIIPYTYDIVAAWDGIKRDLENNSELAQYVSYLRHHGFPTPLLDFTYSPYIAAFFAFEKINHYTPENDHVCIYCFDKEEWIKNFKQSYDYRDKNNHVSVLEPSSIGNPKQLLQQGVFLYTNTDNVENHINLSSKQTEFLKKYRISSKERSEAMRDLRLMNITSMQLFPSLEGVCGKLAIDIELLFPMGKTKSEINTKGLLENLLKISKKTIK